MVLVKNWLPLAVVLLAMGSGLPAEANTGGALSEDVFAMVDGAEISAREFMAALRDGGRRKFYHGRPPEEELVAFRREVGEGLIDRRLLVAEAQKRKTPTDQQWVDQKLEAYTSRLTDVAEWQENAETLLPQLRARLAEDSQVQRLEAAVKDGVKDPDEPQLQAFYRSKTELFTTPEQIRVAVVVFRLPPWAPSEQWEETRLKAQAVWEQLEQGAPFDELAQIHSQDPSADQGGDLGFLHKDMLGGGVQEAVDKLEGGQYTVPLRTLEGWLLAKLVERKPPVLNAFDAVRERAKALWIRQTREEVWEGLKSRLRREANIAVNKSFYQEPAAPSTGSAQEASVEAKE